MEQLSLPATNRKRLMSPLNNTPRADRPASPPHRISFGASLHDTLPLRATAAVDGPRGAAPALYGERRDGGRTPPLERTRLFPAHDTPGDVPSVRVPSRDDGAGHFPWSPSVLSPDSRSRRSTLKKPTEARRPVPDPTAFDLAACSPDGSRSRTPPSPCPPSPEREPPWRRRPPLSLSGDDLAFPRSSGRPPGSRPVASSLDATKILLEPGVQADDALRSRLPSSDVDEAEHEDDADALPRLRPEARRLLGANTQKRRRAHVHAAGFVHLDVKPSNLLIAADGALKLGDFGLVAPLGERPVDGAEGDDRYLSAECLRGDHEHAASVDVFALGISILELSTRQPLPASGDKWHALRRNGAPRLPAASDAFDALVKRCMDADPRRRPAGAELASHPLASTADSKATKTPPVRCAACFMSDDGFAASDAAHHDAVRLAAKIPFIVALYCAASSSASLRSRRRAPPTSAPGGAAATRFRA
ncbi:protein kinase [Aureococcus anophagefferens]|nr:protein kinase [Aureococcus anophagefferens]